MYFTTRMALLQTLETPPASCLVDSLKKTHQKILSKSRADLEKQTSLTKELETAKSRIRLLELEQDTWKTSEEFNQEQMETMKEQLEEQDRTIEELEAKLNRERNNSEVRKDVVQMSRRMR